MPKNRPLISNIGIGSVLASRTPIMKAEEQICDYGDPFSSAAACDFHVFHLGYAFSSVAKEHGRKVYNMFTHDSTKCANDRYRNIFSRNDTLSWISSIRLAQECLLPLLSFIPTTLYRTRLNATISNAGAKMREADYMGKTAINNSFNARR